MRASFGDLEEGAFGVPAQEGGAFGRGVGFEEVEELGVEGLLLGL